MDKFLINVLVPTVCQLVKIFFLINSSKPVYLMHPLLPGQHMCCHGYLYGLLSMLKCHVYDINKDFLSFFLLFFWNKRVLELIALNCQQASQRVRMFVCLFDGGYRHFQQYFSFIGRGNWSTRRKPQNCRKSLSNFIT